MNLKAYWGRETQKSLENFQIGSIMPWEVIEAGAIVKKSAAQANALIEEIPVQMESAIIQVCDEIITGDLYDQFPLVTWQTGSGTATNMNLNEVIASRANEILEPLKTIKVHPNDHINKSQSSNDVFATIMHVAAINALCQKLFPALKRFINSLDRKAEDYKNIIKVGRTHYMDAAPIPLGLEFSTFSVQLEQCLDYIEHAKEKLFIIPLGGTAVGTGLNCHKKFADNAVKALTKNTGYPFSTCKNKLHLTSAHSTFVYLNSGLKTLATVLLKLTNDIRFLSSGPRCGIGELSFPENEKGSSIMPGKVNPTQAEALAQVCVQVIANECAVTYANSLSHCELNTYKPLIIYNTLQSISLLSQSCNSFRSKLLDGLTANEETINHHLDNSLMRVTALNNYLGYDKATQIAKKALNDKLSIQEAVLACTELSKEQVEELLDVNKMINV